MVSIDEKRVYGERAGATAVYVASDVGVVRVLASADAVGEFSLLERCVARDVASGTDALAVATPTDVLVRPLGSVDDVDGRTTPEFESTGFGSATAVDIDDGRVLAAGEDGRIAQRPLEGGRWEDLEYDTGPDREEGPAVRAISGDLLATDVGVYRLRNGRLEHAGLSDVRDVSAPGVPLAATTDGLYKLGNGWMPVLEGAFDTVTAAPSSQPGRIARAHATSGSELYAYDTETDTWAGPDRSMELDSSDPLTGVAYGETTYAISEGGTFFTADESSWRSQTLGVGGVSGLTVALTDS